MKVLIYYNDEKQKSKKCLDILTETLKNKDIPFSVFEKDQVEPDDVFNALFVIGGDGTILRRTKYANTKNIPIIGLNAGNLGFLTEFELEDVNLAVEQLLSNNLKKDLRTTLTTEFNGQTYYALNDIVVQRVYNPNKNLILDLDVSLSSNKTTKIIGDGVIVCTPTGSTAYSLSCGGSILAPNINAFSITAISPHSFLNRPIIYSANDDCKITFNRGGSAGIFIDGKLIGILNDNQEIQIKCAKNPTVFLRKNDYDFYKRLSQKLNDRGGY